MVAPKGIEGGTKKKVEEINSSSSSPEPFEEPDGMTTIDLDKNEVHEKESEEDRLKRKQRAQIKYVARLLTLLCSLLIIVMVVFTATFLNREYQLFTALPFNNTKAESVPQHPTPTSTSSEDILSLTKMLNQDLFRERLESGTYLDDSHENMDLCRKFPSLETCCHVFKDTDLHQLIDYCTVNDMLDILLQYEMQQRRKRDVRYPEMFEDHVPQAPFLFSDPRENEQQVIFVEPHISTPKDHEFQNLNSNPEGYHAVGLQRPEDFNFQKLNHPYNQEFLGFALPERTREHILEHVTVAPKQEFHYMHRGLIPHTNIPEFSEQNLFYNPEIPPMRVREPSQARFEAEFQPFFEHFQPHIEREHVAITQDPIPLGFGLPQTDTNNHEESRVLQENLQPQNIETPSWRKTRKGGVKINDLVRNPQENPLVSKFVEKQNTNDNAVFHLPPNGDSSKDSIQIKIPPNLKITKKTQDTDLHTAVLPEGSATRAASRNMRINQESDNTLIRSASSKSDMFENMSNNELVGDPQKKPSVTKFGDTGVLRLNVTGNGDLSLPENTDASKNPTQKNPLVSKFGDLTPTTPPTPPIPNEDPSKDFTQKKPLVSKFGDSVKITHSTSQDSNNETIHLDPSKDLHPINIPPNLKFPGYNESLKVPITVSPNNNSEARIATQDEVPDRALIGVNVEPSNVMLTSEVFEDNSNNELVGDPQKKPPVTKFGDTGVLRLNVSGNGDFSLPENTDASKNPTQKNPLVSKFGDLTPTTPPTPPIPNEDPSKDFTQKKPLVSKFGDSVKITHSTSQDSNNETIHLDPSKDLHPINIPPNLKFPGYNESLKVPITVSPNNNSEARIANQDETPDRSLIGMNVAPSNVMLTSEVFEDNSNNDLVGDPQKKPSVTKFGDTDVVRLNTTGNFSLPENTDASKNPTQKNPLVSKFGDLTPTTPLTPPIPNEDPSKDFTQKKPLVSKFGDSVKITHSTSQDSNNETIHLDPSKDLHPINIPPNLKFPGYNESLKVPITVSPNNNSEARIATQDEAPDRSLIGVNMTPSNIMLTSEVFEDNSNNELVGDPQKKPSVTKFGDTGVLRLNVSGNGDLSLPENTDASKNPTQKNPLVSKFGDMTPTTPPTPPIPNEDPSKDFTQKKPLVSKFGDSVKITHSTSQDSNNETIHLDPSKDLHPINIPPNLKFPGYNESLKVPITVSPNNSEARIATQDEVPDRSLIGVNRTPSNVMLTSEVFEDNTNNELVGDPQKKPSVTKFGDTDVVRLNTTGNFSLPENTDASKNPTQKNPLVSKFGDLTPTTPPTPPIPNEDPSKDFTQKKPLVSKFGDSVKITHSTSQDSNNETIHLDPSKDLHPINIPPNLKFPGYNESLKVPITVSPNNNSEARIATQDEAPDRSLIGVNITPLNVMMPSDLHFNKVPQVSQFEDSLANHNEAARTSPMISLTSISNNDDSISAEPERESIVGAPFNHNMMNYDSQYLRSRSQGSSDQDDFRPKNKSPAEAIQSTQQIFSNPCYYPYMNPYMPFMPMPTRPGIAQETGYLKVVPASQPRAPQNQPMFVLNPSMLYGIPQTYSPNSFVAPSFMPQMQIPQPAQVSVPAANGPIQVTSPGGQYYMCNPIPTPTSNANNVAGMAQVEVRRDASSLQDLIIGLEEFIRNNKSRAAGGLICPLGEQACEDNSKCIKKHHVCDNEVHCDDSSDETACSCKERVGKLRMCDGYCDCPKCEDEDGCFGCSDNEFSCDDWSSFRRSTCIPLAQRCDGIKQCDITGKDEMDCSILADHLGNFPLNKVSNAVGYLHRNYKGKWYPTCFGTELWAAEVCQVEAGPSAIIPKAQMTLTTESYEGLFLNILPNNQVSLVNTCVQDRATFVECPPIYCGLRFLVENPYRTQEVDTSIEEILNELERAYNLRHVASMRDNLNLEENEESDVGGNVLGVFNDKFETIFRKSEIDANSTEEQIEDTIRTLKRRHAESRVVGGRPSQPAAWPWLVSIYKNGLFHCAGVLINELWIVTASHCVDRYWQYYYEIQAGTLRRFSYAPMDQRRWAKVVIPHELYDKENLRNDIALMMLSAPIRYNRHVRPICLPSESSAGKDYFTAPNVGTVCTTVGWGATIEHGSDPDHMREVEVPILRHCKHKEDSDRDEICAGVVDGGKDACQGDSGGPLMCRNPNNNNQWYLAGVVSHGQGCARPDEPGVYTRVSKYVSWIAEHTRENQINIAHPLQSCPGFVCKGIRRCISKKRRCDGTVDCLLGDDETDCEHQYNEIFKNTRKSMIMQQFAEDFDSQQSDDLVGMSPNGTEKDKNLMDGFDGSNFRCKVLLQVIPMERRCDKHVDCEDGTDEANCSCAHYVKTVDPEAICDGVTDCTDLSDEQGCLLCNKTEFPCRLSGQCIDQSRRCDGNTDCSFNEDELDCVSLTNGRSLTLDKDNRPLFHSKGLVTVNHNGLWTPMCLRNNSEKSVIASSICSLLGLDEYTSYSRYTVDRHSMMETSSMTAGKLSLSVSSHNCENCCDGVFVSCSNISTSSTLKFKSLDQAHEVYFSPWMVTLYSNGVYLCMGTLLDKLWIVTSSKCMENIEGLDKNYTVAVMGKGKMHLSVQGPHEQIVRVVGRVEIRQTDIVLLRLDSEVKFNRYVQAASINARWGGNGKEKCYAVGPNNENKVLFVELFPTGKCLKGFRCFGKRIEDECHDKEPWTGTIICDSRVGWYPAAVFSEPLGHCGLSLTQKYTSIKYHKTELLQAMSQPNSTTLLDEIPCDGLRCPLGQCISQDRICDGVRDCYNGVDESQNLCYEKENKCYLGGQCACPLTDLQCPKTKKCLPKSVFCNGINDCGDYEDEPPICSCRNYLQLTNPEKLCDDIIHCADKTDENPDLCPCKPTSYRCKNSNKCIPNNMVCDGSNDCPSGDDEASCFALQSPESDNFNAGEVMSRTAGIWHNGCFKSNYSSEDLNKLCTKLGFEGATGYQLSPKQDQTAPVRRPVPGSFDVVWLNRAPKRQVKMLMRSSNKPAVEFVNDESCHRLFIACV